MTRTLSETLSSQEPFAQAVQAALASDRSPEAVRALVCDSASSAKLFNLAAEHGVDDRAFVHLCSVEEESLAAYRSGERVLRVGQVQKILERLAARLD